MTSLITNQVAFERELAAANGTRRIGIISVEQAASTANKLLGSHRDALVLLSDRITSVQSTPATSTAVIMMRDGSAVVAKAFTHSRFRPWNRPKLNQLSTRKEIAVLFPGPCQACFSALQSLILHAPAEDTQSMSTDLELI